MIRHKSLPARREGNPPAKSVQRACGAARTALCLGLTLFIVLSAVIVFLAGEPGGSSWLRELFEPAGPSDAGSQGASGPVDDARGKRDGGGGMAAGWREEGGTGTEGVPGDGGADPESDRREAAEPRDGTAFGLFSERDEGDESVADLSAPDGGDRDLRPAGTVYDQATGERLAGAWVLATAYHGTDDPLNAGYPALYQESVEVESDGSFQLPVFDPDDPRLLVHVQVSHPGYLPETAVLRRRDTVAPEWRHREIRLRRGPWEPIMITDVIRAPVRVTPMEDGHALLERETVLVASGRSERLITRGAPSIFYASRYLPLPVSEYPRYLEILHPRFRLSTEPLGNEIVCRVSEERSDPLVPYGGQPFSLTVLDADRAPIADSEVEIQWTSPQEQRTIRAVTDEDGRVDVWLTPPVRYPGPNDPDNATATVLTPAFFKRGVMFKLPNALNEIHIPSRPARLLEFRTVTHPEGDVAGDPVAIAPEGVRVDVKGLTLIRRTSAGEVVFQGAVPPGGEVVTVSVRGYLPRDVTLPPHVAEAASVDLGEIAFARGLEKKIVLEGVGSALLAEATLSVSPAERPERVQSYPLRGAAALTVGGLALGTYDLGVEGPALHDYSGVFEVAETDLDEPVTVPLRETDEETIVVRGRVLNVQPADMALLTVIESYFVEGAPEPVVMKSYAPAPDGTIGSVRRMSGVTGVHLSVLSHEDDAADLLLARQEDSAVFDAGEIRLLRRPNAEITFFVPPFGRLDPPLHVTLEAADGLEAHSRFRSRHRRLCIDNLREGLYQLSWAVGDGGKETAGFEVRGRQTTELQVARSLFAEETIEVRVVDSLGQPVPEAVVTSARQESRGSLELAPPSPTAHELALPPGVQLARVRTRERTTLRVHDGRGRYIPTRADVDPGGVVPTELTLYRPASGEATLLDADGLELDGVIHVSWEPKVPSAITYGEPFDVDVRNGRFRGDLFPPLPMRFTLRLADSEASVTRVFSLPEGGDPWDLGVLRLEETRSLRGVVLLPDGFPAPGATVALLDFDAAWRFPLRDPRDFAQVRYKAETDVQGGFTIEELPLDISRDLVLVASKDGYGDAYEYPLDREVESRELQLEPAATLELDVGYRDGIVREQFRFSLEYQADPADPGTRLDLGEIPAELFGLNTFSRIEPGLYRVKWGLRDFYDPIPPFSEEVMVAPGDVVSLVLVLDGRELRGKASLNGRLVTSGWMLLTEAPYISAGTRVGRIVDGRFLMIDPPRGIEVFGAVIPESKPQALQNIARGEALPARIHGYTASLRNGFLSFDYAAYNLKLRFSDEFLARYPGARLSFPHYEWRDGRFVSYKDSEPITEPLVRLHLLPPGIHTFTVRTERGALLLTRPISLSSGTIQLPDGRTFLPALESEILMK